MIPTKNPFAVVAMGKFTLLFFVTVGLYWLYWVYRNWIAYELVTGQRVFKLWRTLFAVFYIHELFAQIEKQNLLNGSTYSWSPASKAWIFIGAGVTTLLLDYLGQVYSWTGPIFGLAALLVTRLMIFYALYSAQLVINRSAGDPFGRQNQRLTVANQVVIILGLLLWFNFLQAVYLEVTGQLPSGDSPVLQGVEAQ